MTDGGGGASARASCAGVGRCMASAFGNHSGSYRDDPVALWLGPVEDMPTCCPGAAGCETAGAVPTKKFRLFKDLIAPPAECDACACEASEGTCTELPATIEVRSSLCNQPGGGALPFAGPPGWDGSCSADGALVAGAMCNGVPCAQSIWAPPLPGPTTEACAPTSAIPTAKIEPARWATGGLACQGKPRAEQCPNSDETCYEDPGPGWWQCVYHDGIDTECPDNFWKTPIVLYPEEAIDERGCEACTCGDPMGSGCLGQVPIYSDSACQVQTTTLLVSSMKDGCAEINPPGLALGSKKVTGLGYMPGVCAASGGAPKGAVMGNVKEAVTFCCSSSWDVQ